MLTKGLTLCEQGTTAVSLTAKTTTNAHKGSDPL